MTTPARLRWSARSAFAGGGLSILVASLVLANPDYYLFAAPPDFLIPLTEGLALLGVLGGLSGLHLLQRGRYGKAGKAGFIAAFAGVFLAGAGHVLALPFLEFVNTGSVAYVLIGLDQGVFLPLGTVYALGAFLMSLGFVVLGLATARARALPPWCAPVLIGGVAGLWVLGNAGGWTAFGLAWILTGYALRAAERTEPRPTRAR